eukprot:TRINITY_DN82168_c0_g1_i1.p1 TRINITY_DN82168_c0_g1~~TRINITY_DN82168_c0_g1_i1.p1  ORF type:complete len:278 (-),score=44.30 TRINITY_DN82168_c0_g1_i1:23-856(-)
MVDLAVTGHVEEAAECAICFDAVLRTPVLPCRCKVAYCAACWDRALADSFNACHQSRCPTCRSAVRVDFDAVSNCLVFSCEEDVPPATELRTGRVIQSLALKTRAVEARTRISTQARPVQLRLLQEFGAGNPLPDIPAGQPSTGSMRAAAAVNLATTAMGPRCVCQGRLERVSGLERAERLCRRNLPCPSRMFDSAMEHIVQAREIPVQCDLCSGPMLALDSWVWTCDKGNSTVFHASAYDVCDQCFLIHAYGIHDAAPPPELRELASRFIVESSIT